MCRCGIGGMPTRLKVLAEHESFRASALGFPRPGVQPSSAGRSCGLPAKSTSKFRNRKLEAPDFSRSRHEDLSFQRPGMQAASFQSHTQETRSQKRLSCETQPFSRNPWLKRLRELSDSGVQNSWSLRPSVPPNPEL